MTRNLKTLELALVAVCALGAVGASGAWGQTAHLTTEGQEDVTLDISERPGAPTFANALTAFRGKLHCPGTTYTGHKETVTPHESIQNGETKATITPHYATTCYATDITGVRPATVLPNGCDFTLEVRPTVVSSQWSLTTAIHCSSGSGITWEVFSPGTMHVPGNRVCTLEVTGETNNLNTHIAGAHIINKAANPPETPKNYLHLTGTFTDVHVERTGLCVFDGQGTTDPKGELHVDATSKGTDQSGDPLGVTVSD